MSESEILEYVWQSSKKHIIAAIEEYSKDWSNGPSRAAAEAIKNQIRAMPVPRAGR